MTDIRDVAVHQELKRRMIQALRDACIEYDVHYHEVLEGAEIKLAYDHGLKMVIKISEASIDG